MIRLSVLNVIFFYVFLDKVFPVYIDIAMSKNNFDSIPKELYWCGENNENIIIQTERNTIYVSFDKGKSFQSINDKLISKGKEEVEYPNTDKVGYVSSVVQSPSDKSFLFFMGTMGINWVTRDCTRNITALNHGRRMDEIVFHPTEKNWALASAYTLCSDFPENEPCLLYKELYLTKDLGLSWKILSSYIVQFDWGCKGETHIDKGIPKERVLLTYQPRGKGDQMLQGWNYKNDFVYSDDFFESQKLLVSKGNKFLLTDDYLFVIQVVDQESQEVLVLISKSTSPGYNFTPIESNTNTFVEHSYTFLDTSKHSVFWHINHFGHNSQYGHVYTSGPKGWGYNLSLKNNIRINNGQCDFVKVNSVEGVFLANVVSGKFIKNKAHNISYNDYIKTVITFNRGGDWNRWTPPKMDSKGNKYKCGDFCFLNLYGVSSQFPEFYSVNSASGIIIGNGNVGHYLNNNIEKNNEEEVATFLSRDGGLTWFEIRKGAHIYEIGNHGGWIIIADSNKETNKVYYTLDEGLTWEEVEISEHKINVKNILIEPSFSTLSFIIYGELIKGDNLVTGFSIILDFTNWFPICKNPNTPDTSESDYEIWSPSDGRSGHECLLGHKINIIRKKREAHCVNQENFERKVKIINCDCTDSDYQCDLGYERWEIGDPCTMTPTFRENENIINKPPIKCTGVYRVSKGYRRIPGNTCVHGVKYDPITWPCPPTGILRRNSLLLFIAIFIILIVAWYYCTVYDILISNIKSGFEVISGFIGLNLSKQPEYKPISYDNMENEDNMLFEDDTKILNPMTIKIIK